MNGPGFTELKRAYARLPICRLLELRAVFTRAHATYEFQVGLKGPSDASVWCRSRIDLIDEILAERDWWRPAQRLTE
jgi:hypothetical protein